jgi:hypothetical protein
MSDLPVPIGPSFFWMLVFCVTASEEECPPCLAGEGTFVVNDALVIGDTFAIMSPIGLFNATTSSR